MIFKNITAWVLKEKFSEDKNKILLIVRGQGRSKCSNLNKSTISSLNTRPFPYIVITNNINKITERGPVGK
jgi:hypothetical protein